jgi:hypothetical protein
MMTFSDEFGAIWEDRDFDKSLAMVEEDEVEEIFGVEERKMP